MKKIIFYLIILIAVVLRVYKTSQIPPALYWDEASLGYNAYTIATTLRDEHGEFLPLDRFIAFGDYKPPGYIYFAAMAVKLLGLNEFSVRFPSILAGSLMVLVTCLLVNELFNNKRLALLAGFLLAISPWSIQLSRAAFEANLASFFNLTAVYFFILSWRKNRLILLSFIFFVFSFYTFNANRIIAPILLTGLLLLHLPKSLMNIRLTIVAVVISAVMLLPSLSYLQSRESRLRFQEVSIFNNLEPIVTANERINLDGESWWSKLLHNRRLLFTEDFLKHYFDNFSGRFLFTHGDRNPRLSVQDMGELYVLELPFLIMGFYWLVRKKEKSLPLLFIWMLIAPIPAATARESPHALRIASILPTFQIVIAYGVNQLVMIIKRKLKILRSAYYFLLVVLCLLLSANIFYYLHNYYIHYPVTWSGEWQYGYKQMVNYVSEMENNYDRIFVTEDLGRPYIYFAFYNQYPLEQFLQDRKAKRDWYGFWTVKNLGKIRFGFEDVAKAKGKILMVTTPGNLPGDWRLLKTVTNLEGHDIFLIADKYAL